MTTEANDLQIDPGTAIALRDVMGAIDTTVNKPRHRPSHADPLSRAAHPCEHTRYIPTISLNPGNVTHIDGYKGNEGYVQAAVDAFGTIHGGLQRLSEARERVRKDSSRTEANQVLLCAAEAERLQDRAARSFDSARERLTASINAIDKQLSDPLTAKADNSLSAEIRKHCAELPTDKRTAFINEAIRTSDLATLQAVLGGPAYLSGLSREMQKHFTRQYRELTTPDLVVRLDVMRKALELVNDRAGMIFTEVEKALGADWDTVKQLRQNHDAAAQALILVNAVKQS